MAVSISVRLPPLIHGQMVEQKTSGGLTINAYIVQACREKLARDGFVVPGINTRRKPAKSA